MLYTALKHTHLLLVSLFLLSILVKTILLFANQTKFDNYRKKTKVIEMVITMLFLVVGIVLGGIRGFGFHNIFWLKLGAVILAIPITIVAFKKKKKLLAVVGLLSFLMAYGFAEMSKKKVAQVHVSMEEVPVDDVEHGKMLYELNCTTCHGESGASQIGGSADLTSGEYEDYQIANILKDGYEKMPAFDLLDSIERAAIGKYVVTLKKEQ